MRVIVLAFALLTFGCATPKEPSVPVAPPAAPPSIGQELIEQDKIWAESANTPFKVRGKPRRESTAHGEVVLTYEFAEPGDPGEIVNVTVSKTFRGKVLLHESRSDDVWNIVDEVNYENGSAILLSRLWKGYVEYLELYPSGTPRTFLSFNNSESTCRFYDAEGNVHVGIYDDCERGIRGRHPDEDR